MFKCRKPFHYQLKLCSNLLEEVHWHLGLKKTRNLKKLNLKKHFQKNWKNWKLYKFEYQNFCLEYQNI